MPRSSVVRTPVLCPLAGATAIASIELLTAVLRLVAALILLYIAVRNSSGSR